MLPLKKINGHKLVGRQVRTVSELSGCFKTATPVQSAKASGKAFAKASLARHARLSKPKQ